MAESTLSISRVDLKIAVAREIGISRTAADWSTDDGVAVADIIENGERDFYYPAPLPGERGGWQWSFLRPIIELETTADEEEVDLPDDFGGFIGNTLAYQSADGVLYPVVLTSISDILMREQGDITGGISQPRLGAEHWIAGAGSTGQRKSLRLWPVPDDEYTLFGQYVSIPSAITDGAPYPLGGGPHAGTLRAAVMAAAELEMDGIQGPHHAKFMERLAASISFDRQTQAKHMGSGNVDDPYRFTFDRNQRNYLTYNGTAYLG